MGQLLQRWTGRKSEAYQFALLSATNTQLVEKCPCTCCFFLDGAGIPHSCVRIGHRILNFFMQTRCEWSKSTYLHDMGLIQNQISFRYTLALNRLTLISSTSHSVLLHSRISIYDIFTQLTVLSMWLLTVHWGLIFTNIIHDHTQLKIIRLVK